MRIPIFRRSYFERFLSTSPPPANPIPLGAAAESRCPLCCATQNKGYCFRPDKIAVQLLTVCERCDTLLVLDKGTLRRISGEERFNLTQADEYVLNILRRSQGRRDFPPEPTDYVKR